MVESLANHRKFVGTASLYRHIASRKPPFLRRNLNHTLNQHEKLLEASKSTVDGLALEEKMNANVKRDVGWDYPTTEMMEDLLKGQKPLLKLDALQMRRHDSAKAGRNQRQPKIRDDPDWLPHPNIDFRAPCLITLRFIDIGKDVYNRYQKVHVDTRGGIVESRPGGWHGQDRVFDVRLHETFSIEVEKIYVTVEKGSSNSGTYRWKRTIPAHYQLEVEVACQDHNDSLQLLGLLENKSQPKYRGRLTEKDTILRTIWSGLPECPPSGKLLPVSHTEGPEDSIEMEYGLELSMGWSRKRDTPLVEYAKRRRAAIVPEQSQLPTPSASDESDQILPPPVPKRYIITYAFEGTREHEMENLRCPLCVIGRSAKARGRYEHSSFDSLHTHILAWHSHFHPRVEEEAGNESAVIRKTVHLWFSPKSTEKPPEHPGEEEQWIAPDRPFDQKAYLRGQDTWTGHKLMPPGRRPPKTDRPQLPKTQPSIGPPTRPSVHEVSNMPEAQKSRYPVPNVPGVRFYRTVSKRPFEEDEEVSESDDEVDESWLHARLRDDMATLPLSAGAKQFFTDWNLLATNEDFTADVLTNEGVVRFARRFPREHHDAEYDAEFMKFVTRLHAQGIISQEVLEYCSERERFSPVTSGRGDESEGQHVIEGANDESNKPASKVCTCGLAVPSMRKAIICEDSRCSRVTFHKSCVGMTQRQESWRCAECCALYRKDGT